MNESNGNAMIAGLSRAWETEDAARRAYLDKRIAELKQQPDEDETPAPTEVDGLHNPHFQASGTVCLKCHAKELSTKNETGLCRECWMSVGKRRRAMYRAKHEQQGRAA